MKIEVGNYIINSEGRSMWIEEKFIGKTRNKEERESVRRVTGYLTSFKALLMDFAEMKIKTSDAKTVEELLSDMAKAEEDLISIAKALSERRGNEF